MLTGKIVEDFEVNGSEVKIRYPEMGDVDDLLEHVNSLVEEGADIVLEEKNDRDEEVEWLSEMLEKIEKGEKVGLVVEVDGKVVGSADVGKGENVKNHVGILEIGLREEIRDRGIGTKLMEVLISEAKERLDVEIIRLSAFEGNERALHFYRKMGFEEYGRLEDGIHHKNEYKDKILLKRDLRES